MAGNEGLQPYDYGLIDPSKLTAQELARQSADNILPLGYRVLPESYGESVAIIDIGPFYLAAVLEGIGTKNVVADIIDEEDDGRFMAAITQSDGATRANDMATAGARPIVYLDFIATGEDAYFAKEKRMQAYHVGNRAVCDELNVALVGGESQVLTGVIFPGRAVLAGALIGDIKPKDRHISGDKLQAGDTIIMVGSSGIHDNGVSALRDLIDQKQLPDGYATQLPDGSTFGEAILTPTFLYSNLVQALLDNGIDIHRIENVTGHGWAKLMRSKKTLTYEIEELPPPMPVFEFIQEHLVASDKEMYGSYNMGAGYAIYAPPGEVDNIIALAKQQGFTAWEAGKVVDGPRQVEIKPKDITFSEVSFR